MQEGPFLSKARKRRSDSRNSIADTRRLEYEKMLEVKKR
jgi:hypothetical protein